MAVFLEITNPNKSKAQLQYFKDNRWWYIEALPNSLSTIIFEKQLDIYKRFCYNVFTQPPPGGKNADKAFKMYRQVIEDTFWVLIFL